MSPNSMSSSALRTSEAETDLCCLDAATSCALRREGEHALSALKQAGDSRSGWWMKRKRVIGWSDVSGCVRGRGRDGRAYLGS